MMAEAQNCCGRTRDGAPCQARALPGSTLCVFHDPAKAEARAAGRRQGGKTRSKPAAVLPADTPDVELGTPPDVAAFLGRTISEAVAGSADGNLALPYRIACQ
jgi:hypothetical protein